MAQKEQQEVVADFCEGRFNTLVATCIAEEGLDIGQVDLIVSFDASTSPIRNIQRAGRTGRSRSGRVVLLIAAGSEESKFLASNATAAKVKRILSGSKQFKMNKDNPRMIISMQNTMLGFESLLS